MLIWLRNYLYDNYLWRKDEQQHYQRYVKGVSPFANVLDRRWYNDNWTRIVVMTIFVVPFRIMFLVLFIILAYLVAKFTVIFVKAKRKLDLKSDHDVPMHKGQRRGRNVSAALLMLADFAAGYYLVKTKGRRATAKEAPIIVMCPHTGWFDSLGYCSMSAPSIITKTTLMHVPIMGTLLGVTNPVCVDRDNADSRKHTVAKIHKRVDLINKQSEYYPQLCLFPEGTTTSSTMLIQFKNGAFQPGVPVQPVVFHWNRSPDLISYTYDGVPWWALIWLSMCNVVNGLTIEYLPVHVPSEAEKANAHQFARRVQQSIADSMSVTVSDYTFEDIYHLVYNVHYAPKKKFIEHLLSKVKRTPMCKSMSHVWNAFVNNHQSTMFDKRQFTDYMRQCEFDDLSQLSDHDMARFFNAFDWKFERRIDMREYMIARHCTFDEQDFDTVKQMFDIWFDAQLIGDEIFRKLVRIPFTLTHKQVTDIYNELTTKRYPTWGQVSAWCRCKQRETSNI